LRRRRRPGGSRPWPPKMLSVGRRHVPRAKHDEDQSGQRQGNSTPRGSAFREGGMRRRKEIHQARWGGGCAASG
jgi:hypothetical protein